MSMQFNDIIMYTDICENKDLCSITGDHNVCMIWDTVQKYMVCNNAENKRWV